MKTRGKDGKFCKKHKARYVDVEWTLEDIEHVCIIPVSKTLLGANKCQCGDRTDMFSDRLKDYWDSREERAELEKLENEIWWDNFRFELRYWGDSFNRRYSTWISDK